MKTKIKIILTVIMVCCGISTFAQTQSLSDQLLRSGLESESMKATESLQQFLFNSTPSLTNTPIETFKIDIRGDSIFVLRAEYEDENKILYCTLQSYYCDTNISMKEIISNSKYLVSEYQLSVLRQTSMITIYISNKEEKNPPLHVVHQNSILLDEGNTHINPNTGGLTIGANEELAKKYLVDFDRLLSNLITQ